MDSKGFAEAREALAAGISFDLGADSVGRVRQVPDRELLIR